jgi:hypothetical protein
MFKSVLIGAGAVLLLAAPAFACTEISSQTVKLTGCVDEQWQPLEGTGAQEFVYQTADGNFGMMVITEKDAFPISQFHDAIIANAVKGAGGKSDDVKVVAERIENIAGKAFNVLEYTLANSGTPILFQNYYFSQPGIGSIQILGYSLEADATAAAFRTGAFAATVKIGG